MRVIWRISAANGTYDQSFNYNSDEFITDINTNSISYAFYSDAAWATPTAAPTSGTITFTGQNYYPNGVESPVPVAISGSSTTNIADFATAGTSYGFSFSGKCEWLKVVIASLNGSVGSMEIILDRYTG